MHVQVQGSSCGSILLILQIGGDIPIGGVILEHDYRRRYLLDSYLEKSPIFEERA
jgi:hypothetical protein